MPAVYLGVGRGPGLPTPIPEVCGLTDPDNRVRPSIL